MLRISCLSESLLKLEGKLTGPWVEELRQACAWREPLTLDLAAVTFVDDNGLSLLAQLRAEGVRLSPCAPLIEELLQRGTR